MLNTIQRISVREINQDCLVGTTSVSNPGIPKLETQVF